MYFMILSYLFGKTKKKRKQHSKLKAQQFLIIYEILSSDKQLKTVKSSNF